MFLDDIEELMCGKLLLMSALFDMNIKFLKEKFKNYNTIKHYMKRKFLQSL